jgi:hypothetical protein
MRSGNPIISRAEDRLGRAGFADYLAQALRQAPADQGLVVALMGDWGSGKTSVLNMVKERLAGTPTRPDQAPQQGIFAVAGDTPTATSQDYRYLSVQALMRMALDWGYLDAPAGLRLLAP